MDALVGSAAGIRVDVKDESNGTLRTALWTGKVFCLKNQMMLDIVWYEGAICVAA